MGEFNVNKSTGDLVSTAGMPETYPAQQVMMSDGVTSVEEKIDAHNVSTNTRVDITDYTSQNPYKCPCDGYVRLDITTGQKYISIDNVNMAGGIFSNETSFTLLVKKGMELAPSTGNGTFVLYFYPFE